MARPIGWILSAVLLLTSCVSVSYRGRGERAWAAGDLEGAARAYQELLERDPAPEPASRALYRLALIHALPDSPLPDLQRAARLLERLVREHPDSSYAAPAALILDLQGQVQRLRELSEAMTVQAGLLQREADRAVQDLKLEMGRVQGEAAAKQERIGLLERQIGALRRQLDGLAEEMARLEQELERIKQIDLETPP